MYTRYLGLVSPNIFAEYRQLRKELTGRSMLIDLPSTLEKEIKFANKRSSELEIDLKLSGRELKKATKASCEAVRKLGKKRHRLWNEDDILDTHFLVTQGEFGRGYRQLRASWSGSRVSFPSPQKIPYHILHFKDLFPIDITNLEKSILTHFHGVRIHPFRDGNKRTFRLMQNALLYEVSMPPFIIELPQRDFYMSLFEDARLEARDVYDSFAKYDDEDFKFKELYLGIRPAIQRFADFMATEVNISANKILENRPRPYNGH